MPSLQDYPTVGHLYDAAEAEDQVIAEGLAEAVPGARVAERANSALSGLSQASGDCVRIRHGRAPSRLVHATGPRLHA